jgi:hypothetical protein
LRCLGGRMWGGGFRCFSESGNGDSECIVANERSPTEFQPSWRGRFSVTCYETGISHSESQLESELRKMKGSAKYYLSFQPFCPLRMHKY